VRDYLVFYGTESSLPLCYLLSFIIHVIKNTHKASDSTGKTEIFAVRMFNIKYIYGPMGKKTITKNDHALFLIRSMIEEHHLWLHLSIALFLSDVLTKYLHGFFNSNEY
jgi:hypothetical protein